MSRKKINQNNSDIYGELVDFQDRLHAQNLKRIHIGLLCVLIIPMIFLALMFITDSNKVIWLILWIVSLFAISSYLIVVEYGDYNLQHRINSITGSDAEPVPLLDLQYRHGHDTGKPEGAAGGYRRWIIHESKQ